MINSNSASKCLKIVLNFQNQKKKIPQKIKLRGISPLESFEGGLIPHPLWRKHWGRLPQNAQICSQMPKIYI
jgi:hypothetical protein